MVLRLALASCALASVNINQYFVFAFPAVNRKASGLGGVVNAEHPPVSAGRADEPPLPHGYFITSNVSLQTFFSPFFAEAQKIY